MGVQQGSDFVDAGAKRYLLSLLLREKRDISIVVLYGLAIGILSLAVPIAGQNIVNAVMLGNLVQPIVILTMVVFLVLGLNGIFRVLQRVLVEILQNRIFAREALILAERLPRVSQEELDDSDGAELLNRFFEVTTIQKAGSVLLIDGIAVLLQTFIGLVLLASYHPFLLVFGLLIAGFFYALVALTGERAAKTSIRESVSKYEVIGWLEQLAKNPVLARSSPALEYVRERADALVGEYLHRRKQHFRSILTQLAGVSLLHALASAALLGLGGWLVIRGQLSLGQLVASELVLTASLGGFTKFAKYLESYYDLIASADKVTHLRSLEIEDETTRVSSGDRVSEQQALLEADAVIFEFNNGGRLGPMSFSVGARERVALMGPNGIGKSSIASAIYGLRDFQSGKLTLNGLSIRHQSYEQLRQKVALVRGIEFFPTSILENLTLGKNHSIEEVHRVLQDLGLLEDLNRLPRGLNTVLQGSLNVLSSGQLHRLMLARALLQRPSLVVIDENLDQIDSASLKKVLDTLTRPENDFGLLVLTHDSGIARRMDRTIQLGANKNE